MRILLITVAGLSTRFSESVGEPTIKCLYYENDVNESLLHRMLEREGLFDRIVIVGGWRFDELESHIKEYFPKLISYNKLILVYNDMFADYGSGYSFYKGIEAVRGEAWDELVFAEGDLFLDDKSFEKVCLSRKNVITCGSGAVEADKSVALYLDAAGVPHYIFDTEHRLLSVPEPFLAIYNSGQVWKFADRKKFDELVYSMPEAEFYGTNLVPVNRFFGGIPAEDIEYITFDKWINCNTVEDFKASV